MAKQPYLSNLQKGQVYQGRIVCVSTGNREYQDKLLWQVCLRDPASQDRSTEPGESDFNALEITQKGLPSSFRDKIGETISFVVVSPGYDGQLAWVKEDLQKLQCPLSEEGKIELSKDCFKIASDLICNSKADGFSFRNIAELSKRISEHILVLAKNM